MHLGISYAIVAITLINTFMWQRAVRKTPFVNLVFYANVVLGCISLWTVVAHRWENPFILLATYLPFLMVSGPFLFLIYRSMAEKKLSQQTVYAHFTVPFAIALLTVVAVQAEDPTMAQLCFWFANVGLVLLLVFYLFAIGTRIARNRIDRHNNIPFLLLTLILMPLQVIAMIAMLASTAIAKHPTGFVIPKGLFAINDLLAFAAALLLFRCFLSKLSSNNELADAAPNDKSYQKSTLQERDMQQLAHKINEITEKGLYLQPGLSLKDLARATQAPAHHVTQTLSMYMQTDFFELINGKRISQACKLLKETDQKIEAIWQECGFNSRVSFNRHFRAVTGTTPAAFRLANQGNNETRPVRPNVAMQRITPKPFGAKGKARVALH